MKDKQKFFEKDLRHPFSSEKSLQSLVPSHLLCIFMHDPSSHLNCPFEQIFPVKEDQRSLL